MGLLPDKITKIKRPMFNDNIYYVFSVMNGMCYISANLIALSEKPGKKLI